MLPTAQLQSIGKRLLAARVERDLTVEDVAFQTHIPAARVQELENDDFSNFANLTYAKGFLKIYSAFLKLDLDDYLEQFSTSEFANISGHDYIQSANTGMTSLSMAVAPRQRTGNGLWGIILSLAIVIILPIWFWSHDAETAPKAPLPPPSTEPPPKAKVVEAPPPSPTEIAPADSTQPTPPSRPVEIKPAGVRAKIIEDDPPTPPPAPSPTAGAVQVRKALSEVAGEPAPNP